MKSDVLHRGKSSFVEQNEEKAAFVLELLDMRLRGYTNKIRGNPFQLHQVKLKLEARCFKTFRNWL